MIRQEVINVHLAELLCELGYKASAERVGKKRKSPDLTLFHPILGMMLGEAEIGDSYSDSNARSKLESRATDRFRDPQFAFIDFILLVVYPKELVREASYVDQQEIERILKKSQVGVGLANRAAGHAKGPQALYRWFPDAVYPTQIPTALEGLISQVLGTICKPEEVVEQIIILVEKAAEHARNQAISNKQWLNFWVEMANQIEIDVEILKDKSEGAYLAAKMLFTLIAISTIIYEIARVRHPNDLQQLPSPITFKALSDRFKQLRKINYVEIVDAVLNELTKVPTEPTLERILDKLCSLIVSNISVLMRSGWEALAMIYQRLLSETYRKAFATFYTKLAAARLLAELAVRKPYDRVIDPAEGTGSLLLATFYARQWLALRPSSIEDTLDEITDEPIVDRISKNLLERTFGMDALRAAVVLSSSTLTIASLAIPREPLHLIHTPVGTTRAGSLDMLINRRLLPREVSKSVGLFDLVIMNPPFTRSDRIPALIGDEPREKLREKRLTFGGETLDNIFTAGLAKPFLVLAEMFLNDHGRIAAVLPTAVLSRPSWVDVRMGIARAYTIDYVIVNWGPGSPNFSSDTVFREIMMILSKGRSQRPITIINLLEPVDELDARDVATIVTRVSRLKDGTISRAEDGRLIAKVAKIPQRVVEKYSDNLYRLIAFLSPELLEWHIRLIEQCNTRLGDIFEIGSVVDHTSGLRIVEGSVDEPYPAVWGSGSDVVSGPVIEKPTHRIIIEDESRAKVKFWKGKPKVQTFYFSRFFILRRGQLDTQSALAFTLPKNVVSNVWWPIKPKDSEAERIVPAFMVFANSIFGFIYLLGERLETRGLYVEFKKENLEKMPVPNFRELDSSMINACISLLKPRLPRFDRYIEEMSKLEAKSANWLDAAEKAIQLNGDLAFRAQFDKTTASMLECICPKLKPPDRLYQLVCENIQKLREIMEHGDETGKIPADTGKIADKRKDEALDKWFPKGT